MFNIIKRIIRDNYLKKKVSKINTGIIPLSKIKTAVTFIDVEDRTFDKCRQEVLNFYREAGIKGEIFFFDFRKIDKKERLITSPNTTILKRDLNIIGCPPEEKVNIMQSIKPDLFISLIKNADFPIEYMAKCSEAKFKIGRKQLKGNTFDIIISDKTQGSDCSEVKIFETIKSYLYKIS